MAYPVDNADADFYATLDHALGQKVFEKGSSADSVEHDLRTVIRSCLDNSSSVYEHSYICHQAARTLRLILCSWRLLPNSGDYGGYPIDKFDYGYTASHAIRPNQDDPKSLECKVKNCLTAEFKKHRELHAEVLQGIIEGASKAFIELFGQCNLTNAGNQDQILKDLGAEPPIETATYSAIFMHPPTPKKKRTTMGKTEEQDGDADEDDADALSDGAQGPAKSPKTPKRSLKAIETGSGKKAGFDPEATYMKWSKNEDYFIRQICRKEPSTSWENLANRINNRYEGKAGVSVKGTTIVRGPRTLLALKKRFSKFKNQMARRVANNEPTQGTTSDVDPDEEGDGSLIDATVDEEGSGIAGGQEAVEEREDLVSGAEVAANLETTSGEEADEEVEEV